MLLTICPHHTDTFSIWVQQTQHGADADADVDEDDDDPHHDEAVYPPNVLPNIVVRSFESEYIHS